MSNKKMGRPKLEISKNTKVSVRLNEEELYELEKCCEFLQTNKADAIRKCISSFYQSIKK